jgi:lycopene cyclase domain-containing protein
MSLYLIVNIVIIILPMIISFERKLHYYKKIHYVLFSIIVVGIPIVGWDIVAIARGDWWFNPEYTSGPYLWNLPLEELLFFITVPYSMLFLYETLNYYLDQKIYKVKKLYLYLAIAAALAGAVLLYNHSYSFTVISSFVVLILISLSIFNVFALRIYWIWIGLSFFPFAAFNFILTSLPIILYSDKAIIGLRAVSIPVEDFLYSFVLLTSYLTAYLAAEKKWETKKI